MAPELNDLSVLLGIWAYRVPSLMLQNIPNFRHILGLTKPTLTTKFVVNCIFVQRTASRQKTYDITANVHFFVVKRVTDKRNIVAMKIFMMRRIDLKDGSCE